jgi:hypothetical protein
MASKALHAVRRRIYIFWCWMDMQGDESDPAPPRPDPLRVWAQDRSVLRVLWRLQTFVCNGRASTNAHIYPSVLQAVPGWGYAGCLER